MKINNHYLVKLKYKNEVYEKNFFSGEMGKKLNINYDMSTELLNFFYYNYVFDGKINLYIEVSEIKYDIENLVKSINDLCSFTKKNILNITFILKNFLYYDYVKRIVNIIKKNVNIKLNTVSLEVNILNSNEYKEIIKNEIGFNKIKTLIFINELDKILEFEDDLKNIKKIFFISTKNLILSLKKINNYYLLKNNSIKLTDNENERDLLNFLLESDDLELKLLQNNKFVYNVCKFVKFNTYYINCIGQILKCDKTDFEEIVVGSILNGHFEIDLNKIAKLLILNEKKCNKCYLFPTCFNKHCLLGRKAKCPSVKKLLDERSKV